MVKGKLWISFAMCLSILNCQKSNAPDDNWVTESFETAIFQAKNMTKSLECSEYPKSVRDNGEIHASDYSSWTSGFFPGVLWYLYEYSGDSLLKTNADIWTRGLENNKTRVNTHDLGFIFNCSYGNGYRLTNNEEYKAILIEAANSLMKRYNPKVGCIKSWDFFEGPYKWQQFPVIIDNMMNLELLFLATEFTGDSTFYKAACCHADKTMQDHFREDYSSYHVVDYDSITGEVIKKITSQGFNDESTWARGQAWGIYGFTMCYRETGDIKYLNLACKLADFFINHPNLPEDKIPYWDFNAQGIPNAPRDASAVAIVASGLLELQTMVKSDQQKKYKLFAEEILRNLSGESYLSARGENNYFILKHSTGHWPAGVEIDKPLIYADYYYIEALLRYIKL